MLLCGLPAILWVLALVNYATPAVKDFQFVAILQTRIVPGMQKASFTPSLLGENTLGTS
jgi:hypothetical protein